MDNCTCEEDNETLVGDDYSIIDLRLLCLIACRLYFDTDLETMQATCVPVGPYLHKLMLLRMLH